MASETKETKGRKPKARATEIVLGAMDERLQMIEGPHAARLLELCDELRRSLSLKTGGEEAE